MLLTRLQVLTDGQYLHAIGVLVTHHGFDLVRGFAETDRDARLGQHFGVEFLGHYKESPRPIARRVHTPGRVPYPSERSRPVPEIVCRHYQPIHSGAGCDLINGFYRSEARYFISGRESFTVASRESRLFQLPGK